VDSKASADAAPDAYGSTRHGKHLD
jgi:hypothetical protein